MLGDKTKIYDTFLFFNELDLLEIRLNVLHDVVDHFVIVECTKTYQGNDKPLYFDCLVTQPIWLLSLGL